MAKGKKPKCNKKNVRKWVAWLRSGKFRKGTQALRNGRGGYCCLGVASLASGVGKFDDDGSFGAEGVASAYLLVPAVMDWLGIDLPDPELPNQRSGQLQSASKLNDKERHSFRMIADAIEERYL